MKHKSLSKTPDIFSTITETKKIFHFGLYFTFLGELKLQGVLIIHRKGTMICKLIIICLLKNRLFYDS